MTTRLDAIKARLAAAQQHVDDLCTGKVRWTMRVPVDVERDSDTIISGSLADISVLLSALEAAKAFQDAEDAYRVLDMYDDPEEVMLASDHLKETRAALREALAPLLADDTGSSVSRVTESSSTSTERPDV